MPLYRASRRLPMVRHVAATGAVAFPTLTNLIGRWNALAPNVALSGSNVSSVADLSGNAHPLTPGGTGTVPWSATASAHGQPAFNFLAADTSSLVNSVAMNFSAANAFSVFIVGQLLIGAGSSAGLACMINSTNDFADSGGFFFGRDALTSNIWAGQNSGGSGAFTADQAVSLATQYRMMLICNGTTIQIYLNEVAGPSAAAGYVGSANSFLTIGSRFLSGIVAANYWEGPISEIVIGNAAWNATERSNLGAYAVSTWGT